ncbi:MULTISPECIES: hypothetical protein [Mycobacteriaceae]|uniref:hypothetical protein n=1 Tax=Mycobacteriaceae TaxID=1762 RepID=UPI0007EF44A5|nr:MULTISPECIES: hypothetical protein [Mycobacteriaceae]MDO2981387.1 hypothetical protein [Mycobacteroides abscessus subsp. abscessus]OBK70046.1 hypothetical protein A5654_11715 [Mycolicibacterium fortuitum]
MSREFEVTAPEERWLTLTEIDGNDLVRVPCSNTSDKDAVEGALLRANFRPRWEQPGRLVAASVPHGAAAGSIPTTRSST